MNLTFDPGKDAAKQAKHGFSLRDPASFEWATAVAWPGQRLDYDEPHRVALGHIGLRIMAVVFVHRPPKQPRGETLCRNLKTEPLCRRQPKMQPLPQLRWLTLTLCRSRMPNGSKSSPWCAVAVRWAAAPKHRLRRALMQRWSRNSGQQATAGKPVSMPL